MATALSSPLSDPGGCLICQRLALAVVLVDLGNTSKEIIRCFSITARFAGSHPTVYGAIACTIGSRNNSPETGLGSARRFVC